MLIIVPTVVMHTFSGNVLRHVRTSTQKIAREVRHVLTMEYLSKLHILIRASLSSLTTSAAASQQSEVGFDKLSPRTDGRFYCCQPPPSAL